MGGGKQRRQRGPRHLSPVVRLERRTLWTQNAVPGKAVYGESLRKFSGKEHRRWDPTRSKLAAGMLRSKHDPGLLLPEPGTSVLYLGAGHGTSVSHLYDHLCGNNNRFGGRLVCVDLAPRCLRDLTFMAKQRPGLVPVLGDARQHGAWGGASAHQGALVVSRRGASGPSGHLSLGLSAIPSTRRFGAAFAQGGQRAMDR